MKTTKIDLIFSVAPPFTNALAAMLLSLAGRKPLILDLKDDWVDSPNFKQKNIFRQKIERLLEKLIVYRAAAIITVTPQSYKLYKKRYANIQTRKKIHFIPNGCDLEEYNILESRDRQISSDRFLVLSAAWGFHKNYRDFTPVLLALDLFLDRHPDKRKNIDVILLGNSLSSEYNDLLAKFDLHTIVRSIGAVERVEMVEWLWKADLLLLVQPKGNTTAISGTLYEYWATGKAPILLISEDGASSALVEGNDIGTHFHFEQTEQIAAYLEKIFQAYESGHPLWISRQGIETFDRRLLAGQMNDIWTQVLNNHI
jgi:glycosyltransferase involved in cell wall biosynthesis